VQAIGNELLNGLSSVTPKLRYLSAKLDHLALRRGPAARPPQ
jgi:hypothetical protein